MKRKTQHSSLDCRAMRRLTVDLRFRWRKHSAAGFRDKDQFEEEAVKHIETTLVRSMYNCDETAAYGGTALAVRDRMIVQWNQTQQRQTTADQKRIYYLSLEFLIGKEDSTCRLHGLRGWPAKPTIRTDEHIELTFRFFVRRPRAR